MITAKEVRKRLTDIQWRHHLLDEEWHAANSVFVNRRIALEAEQREVRLLCRHRWKHVSDPAGDSGYDECTVCGAER